jgi:hypothetical protein
LLYREYDPSNPATSRLYLGMKSDAGGSVEPFEPARDAVPGYYGMAIDRDDNLHVSWVDNATRELMYSKRVAGAWTTATLHRSDNHLLGVSLSIDPRNRVHLAWFEDTVAGGEPSADAEIMYMRNANGGASDSWEAVQNISNTAGQASAWPRGSFLAAAGDVLAYAWRENVGGDLPDWDIMVAHTENGGADWQERVVATASGPGQQRDPVLVVLADGSVALAYEEWPAGYGEGKKILFGRTTNIVTTDPSPFRISAADVSSDLLIDAYDVTGGLLWLLWKGRYDTEADGHTDIVARYYETATGEWGEPEWATDIGTASMGFKKVAVDPAGTLHLVYASPPTGMSTLYYTARPRP